LLAFPTFIPVSVSDWIGKTGFWGIRTQRERTTAGLDCMQNSNVGSIRKAKHRNGFWMLKLTLFYQILVWGSIKSFASGELKCKMSIDNGNCEYYQFLSNECAIENIE
jgi:hypothetical protein